MTPVEWMQIIVSGASALAALVGIAAALVAVFWRGASFTETITRSVAESERRLRAENQEAHAALGASIETIARTVAESERRLRAENQEAHAALGASIETIARTVTESERRLRAENQEAHTAMSQSIERLGDRLGARIDRLGAQLETLATDVAFLRGRQEERDRA